MLQTTDLPAIYQSADTASLRGQSRFIATVRLRLAGYSATAVGGAFTWMVSGWDLWGVLAALGLLTALSAELYAITTRPDRTWYEGRAAAESAKTLAWRYMVGGDPLGLGNLSKADADSLFAHEIREILVDLDEIAIPPLKAAAHQITPKMRQQRNSDLASRREFYDRERIEDQRGWYAKNANSNDVRGTIFEVASVVLQFGGLVAATLKAFGTVSFDLLGIVAAVGAALLTWTQARQYRSLASAYSVAAQELATIRSLMNQDRSEAEWARFVDESEEAISREHTLWRASRGVAT